MRNTEPIVTLTQAEADKVRTIIVALCGEEFAASVEEIAHENAATAGYTGAGYARHRAVAPIVVDLLFAFDPDFTQTGSKTVPQGGLFSAIP